MQCAYHACSSSDTRRRQQRPGIAKNDTDNGTNKTVALSFEAMPGLCCFLRVTRRKQNQQYNACASRRKQCSPDETKSYSNPTPPRKRQNTPTNGHTPRRMKPTHTRLTYTRMRPHAPSHQAGDHQVPAHTERHNPPKVRTQRQSGLPRRAASSQGQRHRCRSINVGGVTDCMVSRCVPSCARLLVLQCQW